MSKSRGDFDPCPLDPGIDAGGEFDDFGDVGAAYACGGLEEVEAAVGLRLDELGVRDAGDEAERLDDLLVNLAEGYARRSIPVERTRAEDATLMHGLHGRLAVFVGCAEECPSVPGDAFDVEYLAGDEALEEIVRLEIAEFVEDRPDVVRSFDLADADGGGVGAGLQQPGPGTCWKKWRRSS